MDTDTDTDKAHVLFTRTITSFDFTDHGRIKIDLPASEDLRRRAICAFRLMNSKEFRELVGSIQDYVGAMSDAEVEKEISTQYSFLNEQSHGIKTAQ